MKKMKAEHVDVPSFHEAGSLGDDRFIEPFDHLEYNYDWFDDYYHSIVDKSDIPLIMDQLDRGIPMVYDDLLHFVDDDIEVVKYILEKNNFVHGWSNEISLLTFVACQHRLRYQNKGLGKLLLEHALNCGVTYERMVFFIWEHYDDINDNIEAYPELGQFLQTSEEEDEDEISVDLWEFVNQFKPTKVSNQELAKAV